MPGAKKIRGNQNREPAETLDLVGFLLIMKKKLKN